MKLQLYDIIPGLRSSVRLICSIENGGEDGLPFHVLPDTCLELFVSCNARPFASIEGLTGFESRRSFLTLRLNKPMEVSMLPGTSFISVCFFPGSSYSFFPVPMSTLANQAINLSDIWHPHVVDEMEDRLGNSDTHEERVLIIQQFLLNVCDPCLSDKVTDHCLARIRCSNGQLRVNELLEKACLSQRHLARKFNHYLGLSPKEYARMSRFLHALTILKADRFHSLTRIAYDAGYYDQAHFIHDCREFSGFSPTQLLAANNVVY